jgi:BirA family biotin operon repressor/biotin-[acetyl-CoA-carboxylase] ligase
VAGTSLDWHTETLQRDLQTVLPGVLVQALAEVDSTNTQLLARLRADPTQPQLLVAESQSQGRGRNGRSWQSAPAASLTFSLGLPLAPVDWSGLSLAVGVALADTIEPLGPGQRPRLQIKWPNDLWLRDAPGRWRKLGGILIETVSAAGQRACVVGVGLNLMPRDDLHGLGSGHAGVHELTPELEAPALLARVAAPLAKALRRFERDGLAPFADGFARRDLLQGLLVSTTLAAVPEGTAEGIDAQGALRVRQGTQQLSVSSGEVSVRPLAEAPLGA